MPKTTKAKRDKVQDFSVSKTRDLSAPRQQERAGSLPAGAAPPTPRRLLCPSRPTVLTTPGMVGTVCTETEIQGEAW